jgi:DNA-binding MarR family transcriptional regulator
MRAQRSHAFVRLYDAIGRLDGLSAVEVTVLRCFARHCTWATGENAFPRVAEVARDTRYSERWVQKAIRSLVKRELLVEREPATRRAPAVYAVLVDRIAQLTLAEVGSYGVNYVHPRTPRRGEHSSPRGVNSVPLWGELAPIHTSSGSDPEIGERGSLRTERAICPDHGVPLIASTKNPDQLYHQIHGGGWCSWWPSEIEQRRAASDDPYRRVYRGGPTT